MTTLNQLRRSRFRPSSADKLKKCGFFCADDTVNVEQKERGTGGDTLYRDGLQGKPVQDESIQWAIDQTLELSEGAAVLSNKVDCAIPFGRYFDQPGEADAITPTKHAHFDLKSGQEYDYQLQQTAYGFGLMDRAFLDHWTAFVLYSDLRRVVAYSMTFEDAEREIRKARAAYDNPGEPTPNEFCGWCANFAVCPAQRQLAAQSLAVQEKPATIDFEAILADPDKLGAFLLGCDAIKEFHDRAKVAALAIVAAGGKVAGYKRVSRQGNEFVTPADVFLLGVNNPKVLQTIIETYGNLGGAKYRELCEELGIKPDESRVQRSGGSTYLRQSGKG
jgi:hypothetical protein